MMTSMSIDYLDVISKCRFSIQSLLLYIYIYHAVTALTLITTRRKWGEQPRENKQKGFIWFPFYTLWLLYLYFTINGWVNLSHIAFASNVDPSSYLSASLADNCTHVLNLSWEGRNCQRIPKLAVIYLCSYTKSWSTPCIVFSHSFVKNMLKEHEKVNSRREDSA